MSRAKFAKQEDNIWLPVGASENTTHEANLTLVLPIDDPPQDGQTLFAETLLTVLGGTTLAGDLIAQHATVECTLDIVRLDGAGNAGALTVGTRRSGLRDGRRTVAGSAR